MGRRRDDFFVGTVWGTAIGFNLGVTWRDGILILPALVITLLIRTFGSYRFELIAEYFALTVVATTAFGILSYLSMTTARPLADIQLEAADRVLGFDWLAGFNWLQAHSAVNRALGFIYGSLVYQTLYFGALFGLMEKRDVLREMFWIVFSAGILTSACAALFPAYGTFETFQLRDHGGFLTDMARLHAGRDLHFFLSKMTGVVSFPSFHTTMALAYIYGFRRAEGIGWLFAAWNVAMLFAIPFFGGHYLVDMIAGAGVMLLSLAIVKVVPRLIALLRLVTAGVEATA
ncbi:MAG TPA: phosphatase PAP2 family protein [Rhizomicrobium sp.]